MPPPTPIQRPVNWANLRADEAERVIRERAQDTANVLIIGHPDDRSRERDIPLPDIYRILREGAVSKAPERNRHGDWEVVISRRMKGTRDAAAVTIVVMQDRQLIVKTVMWVDR